MNVQTYMEQRLLASVDRETRNSNTREWIIDHREYGIEAGIIQD